MTLSVPIDAGWHPLADGAPPDWASGWGKDEHGVFVEFTLDTSGDWRGVTQRLRWIRAGRFLMGSLQDEPRRYNEEGPLTTITLLGGFWLADTPVTQALWQVVIGENPSRFVSPERPVEQVSWKDAQSFVAELNARVDGLSTRLPSEAEWEYACRAGTTEATYAGPIEILGSNNAPALDAIAWYGGNCGQNFDLDDGHDISLLPERHYQDSTGGTHPVAQKLPNTWGLYDMLGNVWEWCADEWWGSHEGANAEGLSRQPCKQRDEQSRVIRGGSWGDAARYVRSAYRRGLGQGGRYGYLGFRLALGEV